MQHDCRRSGPHFGIPRTADPQDPPYQRLRLHPYHRLHRLTLLQPLIMQSCTRAVVHTDPGGGYLSTNVISPIDCVGCIGCIA